MNVTVLADALAPVLRELVDATAAPILLRLAALEEAVARGMPALDMLRSEVSALPARFERQMAATLAAMPQPEPLDFAPIVRGIDERIEARIAALPTAPTAEEVAALVPAPKDGNDADPEIMKTVIAEEVARKVAEFPAPKDGNDGAPGEKGAPGRDGVDGKDIDPADVRAIVAEAVAALPLPAPGKDAAPEDIAAAVEKVLATWERPKDGAPGAKGDPGPAGAPGRGIAGIIKDHEGCLNVTFTDGDIAKVARIDGAPGNDGVDGLGFEDLDVVQDDTSVTLRFSRGDKVKEWTFAKPTLADFFKYGWKDGTEYKRGAVVMWAGQPWLAMADTKARPESNGDWTMLAKKARDGKDGEMPKPPMPVKLK